MHNYNENTLLPEKYRDRQVANNFNALADYVTFNHYNIWIPAGAFVDGENSNTPVAAPEGGKIPVRVFPDAQSNYVWFAFRKPSMWMSGNITGRIHYTGLNLVGRVAYCSLGLWGIQEGHQTGAGASVITSGVALVPTPSSDRCYMIDRQIETTIGASGLVDESVSMISVRFSRNALQASDDYTTDFLLIGLEVFYIENTASNIGVMRDKNFRHVSKP